MNKQSKILIIGEGAKAERRLMEYLCQQYGIQRKAFVTYGAIIYDLYDKITSQYTSDWTGLNIQLMLQEYARPEDLPILQDNYTDILLVFDFDPGDNRYSAEKLMKLVKFFAHSEREGRLYINYPMLESILDFSSLDLDGSNDFLQSKVGKAEFVPDSKYKRKVNQEGCIHQLENIDKTSLNAIIRLVLRKLSGILHIETPDADSMAQTLQKLAKAQTNLWEKDLSVFVLNTCCLFLYEYRPDMLNRASEY